MTTATAKSAPISRYGSPAQVAAYAGLSTKTVRRLVAAGAVPSYKVGRRVLVPFRDLDRFIQGRGRSMATIHRTGGPEAEAHDAYVPPIAADELARRNRSAIALLDAWEAEGDEDEQRETMRVLRTALGADRVASSRPLFP